MADEEQYIALVPVKAFVGKRAPVFGNTWVELPFDVEYLLYLPLIEYAWWAKR